METIKLNGKTYKTDSETASLLRDILPQAVKVNDFSAAWAILDLGLMTGRITEV